MICEIKLVISHIMKHFILMADVVKSRDQEPVAMMQAFHSLVRDLNTSFGCRLLSPLTITLGDEFQGVPDSFLTEDIEEAKIPKWPHGIICADFKEGLFRQLVLLT